MIGKINAAIQVLPRGNSRDEVYARVDKAIDLIKQSGLRYEVTPFETNIEGDYDEVMALIKNIQLAVVEESQELLSIIKIQMRKGDDVFAAEKTDKHK